MQLLKTPTIVIRTILFFIVTSHACYAQAQLPSPVVLINHRYVIHGVTSNYFKPFPKNSLPRTGNWKGLFCNERNCEIADAVVEVKSGVVMRCGDEDGDPADLVSVSGSPIAIFNGVSLNNGKVVTQLRAMKGMFHSSHFMKLRKLGTWQLSLGDASIGMSWTMLKTSGSYAYQYRYYVSNGATKQLVFSTVGMPDMQGNPNGGGEITPFVHWAGDLDGDGKIDLLLDIPYDMSDQTQYYCEISERLYLSSSARSNEVLYKAAQGSGSAPGCGC